MLARSLGTVPIQKPLRDQVKSLSERDCPQDNLRCVLKAGQSMASWGVTSAALRGL